MTDKECLESIVVDLVPKAKENNEAEIKQLEKSLEVLEILKNNGISISYIEESISYDDYISKCDVFRNLSYITKEKYIKLKEWIER